MLAVIMPQPVIAADQDAMFEFHPHCIHRNEVDKDWMLGPIPSPGIVVETRKDEGVTCSRFAVHDPQTLKTSILSVGDILDIDVVIHNPSKQDIKRAKAWLSYDPEILEGEIIELNETFNQVTPGESDFSPSDGYIKLEASAESPPDDRNILFARIQFTVKQSTEYGSPISFYDPQPDGHSEILAADGSDEAYILEDDPGVLLVVFGEREDEEQDEEVDEVDEPFDDGSDINPFDSFPESDNSCIRDEDCNEGFCVAGQCTEAGTVPNGDSCSSDALCESGLCGSGVCIPSLTDTQQENEDAFNDQGNDNPNPFDTAPEASRTAFALLQIRNLRVTTDGSSAFLAWDRLRSSQLRAYNIYYGTTSGRYIQRKTIDKTENSVTIRSLSIGQTYYFAVRALSKDTHDSAFTREVSVTIGDPDSSTALLTPGSINDGLGKNPLLAQIGDGDKQTNTIVPGETGIPSILALFAVICAVIGTGFASRRQLAVSPENPYE